jgi:selenocysteine lyase/cysteine desulfurase
MCAGQAENEWCRLKINVLQTVAELTEFDITSSNKILKDKKIDDDEWEKISENKAVIFTHVINCNGTVKTLAVMNAYAVQLMQIWS